MYENQIELAGFFYGNQIETIVIEMLQDYFFFFPFFHKKTANGRFRLLMDPEQLDRDQGFKNRPRTRPTANGKIMR